MGLSPPRHIAELSGSAPSPEFHAELLAESDAALKSFLTLLFSYLSLVASILLLIIYFGFRTLYPRVVDRLSLRIVVGIGVADLVFSAAQIYTEYVKEDGVLCVMVTWAYVFCTLLALFYTVVIAFNLQMSFVYGRNLLLWERAFFVIPLLSALGISLLPVVFGRFGYIVQEDSCWYRDTASEATIAWMWGTLFMWVCLTIMYCFVVVFIIAAHLYRSWKNFVVIISGPNARKTAQQLELEIKQKRQKEMMYVVVRVLRYPVVPIITQSFNIIHEMTQYISKNAIYWIMLASYLGGAAQGLVGFLAFCTDPAIKKGFRGLMGNLMAWSHKEKPEFRYSEDPLKHL